MKNKLNIEFQHFHGCPNRPKLLQNLLDAMKGYEDNIDYIESIIDTNELARRVGFLGSPTILIDGQDLMGLKPILNPSLSCRFYVNGLPTVELIRETIKSKIDK
jgi:hypothetical protein